MVMAAETDILDSEQDSDEDGEVVGKAAHLHEQLVRHVLAVSGELYTRSDVWGEHSYAKARGSATNSHIRSLLPEFALAPDADDVIDVDTEPMGTPAPPLDDDSGGDEDFTPTPDDDTDGDWEERLAALAPSATHAHLARAALGALRALRLERLAGARGRWGRRESARAAARRLRRALAPHWSVAGWLHAALLAYLPPAFAALYSELVAELRRAVPRLAARLAAPTLAASYEDPLAAVGERRDANAPGPWLAWAPSGSGAEDDRWVRRLGALLHTRVLRPAAAAPAPAPSPPDRWCSALAHDARTALSDVLGEAGRRAVVVCGWGAGAALAAWLAAGARVSAALLLAPALLSAEGPRDRPGDVLDEVSAPMLTVVGGGAAACWRGAAGEACAGRGARRVLLVPRADDALRLPRAARRALRLPQHALDAAITEESVRWAIEMTTRRRHAETAPDTGNRTIEIIEGRVVTRASGASPLPLALPRRSPRPDALAAADIMQLPIVFADDELTDDEPVVAATRLALLDDEEMRPRRRDDSSPPRARYVFADKSSGRLRRLADDELMVTSGGGEARRVRCRGGMRGGARGAVYPRVLVAKRGGIRGGRPIMLRRRAPPAPH